MGKMNGKNADELFEKYKDWIKKVNATSVYNYYLKVERKYSNKTILSYIRHK